MSPTVGMLQTTTSNQSTHVGIERRNRYVAPLAPAVRWSGLTTPLVIAPSSCLLPPHPAAVDPHDGNHGDEQHDGKRRAEAEVALAERAVPHLVGDYLRAEVAVGHGVDDVEDLHHRDE